ncbi:MAG: CDP-alcohol phosphatidyltransferase family protein [Verrucomicrobia bacterium]|nr:CDP-alcohol phosphatidyltransferase family protein [Verrucomicrobiota bacterium]
MTTATRITIARFFFAPPLVVAVCGAVWWPEHALAMRVAAMVLFGVGALTDFLDGFVARRFGQETRLGAALDPMADKVLLWAAIWSLWACQSAYNAVPAWYPAIVTLNDAMLGVGFVAVRRRIDPDRMRAMIWGKAATVGQIVVVAWLLPRLPGVGALVIVAGAMTAFSGTAYVTRALQLMDRTTVRVKDSTA